MGNTRGSVGLMALLMVMVLGSLGVTLHALSKTDIQIAANHRDGVAAQYLAEAGIQEAIAKLKTDSTFVTLTARQSDTTISKSLGTLPTVGNYIVQTSPDFGASAQDTRLITATGKVNTAQRQVIAKITLQSEEHSPVLIIWNY